VGDTLENARVISIEVRDSDFGGMSSDHIGTLVIPFAAILNSPTRAINGWFKLMPEDSAKTPDLISKADVLHNGEVFVQFVRSHAIYRCLLVICGAILTDCV
jgi:hypothetical protein